MNSNQQHPFRREAGFSLVEIMVVITIIALLAGLVGSQVIKKLDEAKVNTAKIQMRNFESALDEFRRQNGFYPTSAQGLSALITKPGTPPEPKNYDPEGYLKITGEDKGVPKDPWGNEYIYESESQNKYRIVSRGSDDADGGEGTGKDIVLSN